MHEARPDLLPESIRDRPSNGFDKTDAPNVNEISGPKTLAQQVKQPTGGTVRRIPTKKQ